METNGSNSQCWRTCFSGKSPLSVCVFLRGPNSFLTVDGSNSLSRLDLNDFNFVTVTAAVPHTHPHTHSASSLKTFSLAICYGRYGLILKVFTCWPCHDRWLNVSSALLFCLLSFTQNTF